MEQEGQNTPPDWVFDRVEKLTGGFWPPSTVRDHPICVAFARYIAEHEEAPVDPLLIEARILVASRYEPKFNNDAIRATLAGEDDEHQSVQNCLAALRRGMELAQAGGSK